MSDAIQLDPITLTLGHNCPVPIVATKPSQVAFERFRPIPDTGLALTAFCSLTVGPSAAAIHGDVSIALTEAGATGHYYGELLGANLTARLTVYADTETPIYLIVASGTTLRMYADCRVRSASLLGGT